MTEDIEGRNVIDFIFPDTSLYQEERKELEKYLSLLFAKTHASAEIIDQINPLVNKTIHIKTKTKVIEKVMNAKFIRIYNGDVVEHVIIIFEDKTGEVRFKKQLEKEKTKYQSEIEYILAILRSGPDAFFDFIHESTAVLEELKTNINKLDNENIRNSFFRKVHSLKGTAKYFELNHLAHLSHSLEDILAVYKTETDNKRENLHKKIMMMIDNIWNEFRTIDKTNTRFQMFYERAAHRTTPQQNDKLTHFITSLKRMTANLSKEQGKQVELSINKEIETLPHLNKLKDPIIQILRNAVYHGIEDNFERLSLNKKQTGKISLHLFRDDHSYCVEIADDGRGINFNKILKKAIDKQLIRESGGTVNKRDLVRILFSPEFSSADNISCLSGRGFGLNIVKTSLFELHGKVSVTSREKVGTRFLLKIPETIKA
jgi:two-component system chemotaxis sensor kinase CheA